MSFAEDRPVAALGAIGSVILAIAALSLAAEAFSGKKTASERVWVTRPDGSLQCDPKPSAGATDPIAKAKSELEGAGVRTYASRKRNDGRMRAAACGIATGEETAFEIDSSDLAKARARGFAPFRE